ncbi:MAG: LarC family nickel insertion protein [Acidobacteria bacterium]|jgi:uncharacterized protein (DUF111 family)|nr:LarC family nickel insertion protein [Acidobacteriota bacterium]
MRLLIDAQGGMAGDMFSAALISAGANFDLLQKAMHAAGQELGSVQIDMNKTPDGASQLAIKLNSQRQHLGSHEAVEILTRLFDQFDIQEKYRTLGMNILGILVKAEKKAHRDFNIIIEENHNHNHHHEHNHHHHESHGHNHDAGHQPHHSHGSAEVGETFLHEAQDIIIDIMGATMGMQLLNLEPKAKLLGPVSVGGGHVHFSHGTLSVPAPATSVILAQYNLPWQKGPIEKELFTPTGAAILAALEAKVNNGAVVEKPEVKITGISRGTKILDIPPLKLLLY